MVYNGNDIFEKCIKIEYFYVIKMYVYLWENCRYANGKKHLCSKGIGFILVLIFLLKHLKCSIKFKKPSKCNKF